MGWTKADRVKFLRAAEECRPKEAIVRQTTLFEDIVEDESNKDYQKIKLILKYPIMTGNLNGDPMPKQSARFAVSRHMNGPKKGEPILFTNKYTGKADVMIKSYQEAKITNTVSMLREQIIMQMESNKYKKFKGAIFITKMEFVFEVSKNAPKYMINDLKENSKIYFKDTKPDLDNLEKMILDAMETEKLNKNITRAMLGLVYDNDAQIVFKSVVFKRWGLIPGVIIEMEGKV